MPPYFSFDYPYYDLGSGIQTVLGVYAAVFAVLWTVCRIFKVKRLGIPQLGAVLVALPLSLSHLEAIPVVIVPLALGFILARSTKVLSNPAEVTSPRIKLTYGEYAFRAEQYKQMMQSQEVQMFFSSPYSSLTQKLTLFHEMQGMSMYRHARGLALITGASFLSCVTVLDLYAKVNGYIVLFLLSFPFGIVTGMLWKYIKGHPGKPKMEIGGRKYYPTFRSYILSALYRLTPAIVAAVLTCIYYEKSHVYIIIMDVITGLFCFYLFLSTIAVHLTKIHLLDEGVIISGFSRPYGLKWEDIDKADVRERRNWLSRADKLLVLYTKAGHRIAYPVSILSKKDETEVLQEVRKRVPTSSIFDSPSL